MASYSTKGAEGLAGKRARQTHKQAGKMTGLRESLLRNEKVGARLQLAVQLGDGLPSVPDVTGEEGTGSLS